MRAKILLVEDEEALRSGLRYALDQEGYAVAEAADGERALQRLRAEPPDLVLLDIMMPCRSGFEVLEKARAEGFAMPVILLTARGQEADKVRGLDLGADDYLVKPFGLSELLARVRARLRRAEESPPAAPERFALGPVRVDLAALEVRRDGARFPLSVREADMLRLLLRERGKVVSRNRFLHEVWGHDGCPSTRTVDQHVAKLRKKLEADPAAPRWLRTVFGAGYRLESS